VDSEAFNAFEAAGWNAKAASYDELAGQITRRVVEPLVEAADVGPGLRVLDVATGPGYAAAEAASRGAQVIGVDISDSMVELAAERNPGIDFRRADAEELPFADGFFDRVIVNFGLLHFGNPERAADELARVLAPDGRLALTVWDTPDRSRLHGVFLDAVAEGGATHPASIPEGPPFFRFSDDGELAELLHGSSFADLESTTIAYGFRIASGDELWDGLLAGTVRLAATIESQPAEGQARIREAFDRLLESYRADDGYELPVAVKLTSCRKPAGGRA